MLIATVCSCDSIRLSNTKFSPWRGFCCSGSVSQLSRLVLRVYSTLVARASECWRININIVCLDFCVFRLRAAATIAGAVVGSNHHHLLIAEPSSCVRARFSAVCAPLALCLALGSCVDSGVACVQSSSGSRCFAFSHARACLFVCHELARVLV